MIALQTKFLFLKQVLKILPDFCTTISGILDNNNRNWKKVPFATKTWHATPSAKIVGLSAK